MYLALIPDADSCAALGRFAPSLPSDAHVTIIHSKADPKARVNGVLTVPKWSGSVVLNAGAVAVFGGRSKVLVLKLIISAELCALREQAENILRDAGLPWSAEWPLSPHVTLGGSPIKIASTVGEAPTTLRFDRMEWR